MDRKKVIRLVFLTFVTLVLASSYARSMMISNKEYMNAYFVMYADYLSDSKKFTQDELLDVVRYYLTTEDLAGNLYKRGDKSGEMIGNILVKAGVNFECGTCDASLLGMKCCIYRADNVPAAYECVGNEVLGVETYSWVEMWQCTFGCCGVKCCLDSSGNSAPASTTPPTTSTTSTTKKETTSSTAPPTTKTTTSSTTSSPKPTTIKPALTILYIPVDWDRPIDQFRTAAGRQTDFLVKNTPLKDCPAKVKTLTENTVCRLSSPLDEFCTNVLEVKRELEACAKRSGEKYDYVVGVWPSEFCGVLGLTFFTGTIFLGDISEEILAHEMGHEWGLIDEYFDACRCENKPAPNCLDAGLGGRDASGTDISGQPYTADYCAGGNKCALYQVSCLGNLNAQGGRCIMGPSGAPGPRAFCRHCMEHLNSLHFLKCQDGN